MNFNSLVKYSIDPIFRRNNYLLIEEQINHLNYKSALLKISISHNNIDNTCLCEIGKINNEMSPLTNGFICDVLQSNKIVESVSIIRFIDNICSLFNDELNNLINGDSAQYKLFMAFNKDLARIYTKQILQEQTILEIDNAWKNNDYHKFVSSLKDLNIIQLNKSYALKYAIALKKISSDS